MDDLEHRTGLPDALRVLVADYPREGWERHRNFDGLTRFWLDRHLMFRQMLADMQGQSQALIDKNQADPRRLAGVAGNFLNSLHGHHQMEDHHYFPQLTAAEPRLAQGFGLLDADHHALDAHIHALAEKTNAVLQALTTNKPTRESAAALNEALTPFGTFLDRHLTDEEELVVPIILHFALRF
jgi:iron-sulfur cluster repair protein YtfE (RIC family)